MSRADSRLHVRHGRGRDLAAKGASAEQVDRMHVAFTKSVMLHVTVWTRAYVAAADW